MPVKNTTKKTTPTQNEEVDTTPTSHLEDSENSSVFAYAQSVVILEKAIETHNGAGITVIDMFETARLRLVEAGMPKKDILKNVYDSAMIIANMPEIEINGEMEPISARANKRMQKELKAVFSYYQEGLSIRHTVLPFTTFEKLVSLYTLNSQTMTKSKISACLKVYPKADKMSTLTDAQIKDLDIKYNNKVKTLIVMVDALNLAQDVDIENFSAEETAMFNTLKSKSPEDIKRYASIVKLASMANNGDYQAA